MNKIIQFVLILAVGLILYFLLNRMMQKLMVELSKILYKEVNPEKYLQVLNSWKGKMFFSRKTRSLMAIDALLMQNETAKIEEIFEQLDAAKMNPANRLGLAQKEVSYYIDTKKFDKALKAYDTLKTIAAKFNNSQVESILKECTFLVEIYIHHNTEILDEVLDLASKMTNPFYQGIFLYRAAKLYYYKNDEENCRKLLSEAMEKLKGTAWEVMIRQMLEENLALVAER